MAVVRDLAAVGIGDDAQLAWQGCGTRGRARAGDDEWRPCPGASTTTDCRWWHVGGAVIEGQALSIRENRLRRALHRRRRRLNKTAATASCRCRPSTATISPTARRAAGRTPTGYQKQDKCYSYEDSAPDMPRPV